MKKQTELIQLLVQNQKQSSMWVDPYPQAPPHLLPGAPPFFYPGAPLCRLPGVPALQPMPCQPLMVPGVDCNRPLCGVQPVGVPGFQIPGASAVLPLRVPGQLPIVPGGHPLPGTHPPGEFAGVQPLGVPVVSDDQNLEVPVALHLDVPGGQPFQEADGQPLFINNGQLLGVAASSPTTGDYQLIAVPAGSERSQHITQTAP